MTDECIKRDAVKSVMALATIDGYNTRLINTALDNIPAEKVRSIKEINIAVNEALNVLNAINRSGRLEYGDYCELFDALESIRGVEK